MADPQKPEIFPPWGNEIPEGSHITYTWTLECRKYLYLFDEDKACGMKYYFYDPTEHGFEKGKEYPLLVFIHGKNNAIHGDECTSQCGAAYYGCDEYQKRIGGAYILIPVANEYMKGDETLNTWDTPYVDIFVSIIKNFISKYGKPNGGINKKILIGTSSGANFMYKVSDAYPKFFNVLCAISSYIVPTLQEVEMYNKNDITFFFFMSKHDEYIDFHRLIEPNIYKMEKINKKFILTPEWIRFGDKGIASNNYNDIEMGQHCAIMQMQYDLLYDDGTPMFEELPDGFLVWLRKALFGE